MYIKGGSQMYKIHFLYSVYENFNNRNNASMIYAFLLFLWLKCAYASSFCLYISLAYLTSITSMHRMHSMHLWTPKAQKFVVLSINHGKSSINGQFPQGWVEDTCWEHWEDIFFLYEKSLAASDTVPSGSNIFKVDWPCTATGKVDRKAWTLRALMVKR